MYPYVEISLSLYLSIPILSCNMYMYIYIYICTSLYFYIPIYLRIYISIAGVRCGSCRAVEGFTASNTCGVDCGVLRIKSPLALPSNSWARGISCDQYRCREMARQWEASKLSTC